MSILNYNQSISYRKKAAEQTAKHTPGPWVCHSGMVWKDGPEVYPRGSQNGIPIATMCREPNNGTRPTERDANAKLIAAAPELLEAASKALTHLNYLRPVSAVGSEVHQVMQTLEQAIRKAAE